MVGALLLASIASVTAPGATALSAESPAAADPNNFAPASRALKPVSVHKTAGPVTAPENLVTGGSTRLSGRNSYVVLDFDKEVGGLVSLRFAGASGAQRVGLAFSETVAYAGVESDRSNQDLNTTDGAIHASVNGAGTYTMPKDKLRGGFRFLTLFLDGDGWVDIDDVTLRFTPDPDRANLRDYPKACYAWTGKPSGFTRECAVEKGTCSFTGMQTVAFGRNGSYVYRTFVGSTACTEAAFGEDPVYGVVKSCYLVS